jgi:hypothetical protein
MALEKGQYKLRVDFGGSWSRIELREAPAIDLIDEHQPAQDEQQPIRNDEWCTRFVWLL